MTEADRADAAALLGENAVKEVWEEAGLHVTADRIIALQDRDKHNPPIYAHKIIKVFVECTSLGGSFHADDIREYYLTPYDLGYGHMVKFDHEFVGRPALERMAAAPPRRRKVTLVWNDDDVAR